VSTGPDSRPRGTRLPRTARRKQLLGAAQEVFVANGYHAAAMDDIAERAGVSKPVLYQHFPGKLELYLALLDEHTDDLVSRVSEALATTPDNKQRVQRCIQAYFDFVADDSGGSAGAFRLVFESDLRAEPAVAERVERMVEACVEAVADTIAQDTGVPADAARLLSRGLIGTAEISARWWLQHGAAIPKTEAERLVAALVWRGISGFPRAGE
jgi:AcrR family transcriptional regulator